MNKRIVPAINVEMERAVLGALLIDPSYLPQVAEFLQPGDFFETKHSTIYAAILALLQQKGTPPDIVQLDEYLRDHTLLADVGGSPYTYQLVNTCATVLHTMDYARTVRELALKHQTRLVGESLAIDGITTDEAERRLARIQARRVDADASDDMPSGDDLPDIADGAVYPFPFDVYPRKLRAFITEAARSIHCPPDFIAAPLLPYLGAAIGNTSCIEIKHGWREYPWLWLALVAQPGDKKSPALAVIDQFFTERQRELHTAFKKKLDEWNTSEERGSTPEPIMEQVKTTDATVEALADLLQDNARGMLFSRDELTAWALSMNQYKNGKGADRQHWLSFWNGAAATINRRSRKHAIVLDRPFVGVVGTLQPDVLGDLSDERGRQDGFIHRILFAYPDRMSRRWTDDEISPATVDIVRTLFDLLWRLKPACEEAGQIDPTVYRFTKAGKEAWIAWLNAHYAEQDAADFADNLRGPWAKMEGYAARLALILHICRCACAETESGDIDDVTMAGVVKLIDYFKSHVRRVYAHLYTPPEEKQIVALLAWVRRQNSGCVTAREVLRAQVVGIKKAEDAKYLLEQLAERGYGSVEEVSPRRGRKVFRFTLNKDAQHPTFDIKASDQTGSAA